MEFGRKDPRQSAAKIHGEWSLWLYSCSWRIQSADSILVACEDERDKIRRILKQILWTEVLQIDLRRPSFDILMIFKNGSALQTFSVNSSGEQETSQWLLFTPDLVSISARGDKLIQEESAHS